MLRVLGTLKRSAYAQNFSNEINDLGSWVSEIHSGMYPHLVRITHHPSTCQPAYFLLTDRCSNQTVCLRTMQMGSTTATTTAAATISTTHRVARSSPQQSTISHSLQATKPSFLKQNVHAQPSSPQTAPLPHHPHPHHPPLPPTPHQHQHHPQSRTHHTLQLPVGSPQSSTLSPSSLRDHKVPRARRSC